MTKKNSGSISTRFKELRSNVLKLTQKELSEELDTTQANLSQIEKGVCLPTGNFMQRIAERFPDVNFNWLFYNEGAPTKSEEIERAIASAKIAIERKAEKKFNSELQKKDQELERLKTDNSKLVEIVSKKK